MHLQYKEKYEGMVQQTRRYKKKYDLLYQWMKLKQNNVEIIEFFQDRKIESAAIYGLGDLGQLIYNDLSPFGIIKFGIDRQAVSEIEQLPIYSLEKVQQSVDAILITPVLITDEIEENIYHILGEQITFVFEEVLFELSRKHYITSELWQI